MQLNQTNCFKVFNQHFEDIKKSLNISDFHRDDIETYVFYRALSLFKLDLLIIEHRQNLDPERFLLFGKNALIHYLLTKKGISVTEARNMPLSDTLIVLYEDLLSVSIPSEIMTFLTNQFYKGTPDFRSISHILRTIKDDEWNSEISEQLLSR